MFTDRPHRFQGQRLTLWLLKLGAQVWGYSLPPEGQRSLFGELALLNRNLNHHFRDLLDLEELKQVVQQAQPEVVLHLAAQPLVRRSYLDPLGTWATNVQGSLHMLEALKNLDHHCAVVMVTKTRFMPLMALGYREDDRLAAMILICQSCSRAFNL